MRKYTPKDNVQKKSYYNDRFWVAPKLPKVEVTSETDEVYFSDLESMKSNFEISEAYIQKDELVVWIDSKINKEFLTYLKESLEYTMMVEMSAVDFLAQRGEFEIFYEMLSISKNKRMRVKCAVKENQAIESVETVFRSANFAEREMYDMFGIPVNNHSFLKRILMPEDWEGHPLLKTYPLQGDEFASWYEVDKIFGKEARDIIGPEIRDSAKIDRYDTERFARLGYEVPKGTDLQNGENEPTEETPIRYQEDGGAFLIEKFDDRKGDENEKDLENHKKRNTSFEVRNNR
jgi:NADH-quinone oxidoreductase subunit C